MATLDDVFDLLSQKRRRYVLYYLDMQDGPVPIDEVVRQVATWETDLTAITVPEDKYREVLIDLQHTHLPKTDEMQFIEYDREAQMIKLTQSPTTFDTFLTVARVIEKPGTEE